MNLVLITIGFLLILTGIVGSFIPIIPGPIAGWLGLFVVYQCSFLNLNYFFLGTTFIIAITVFIFDYIIPSIGAKSLEVLNQELLALIWGQLLELFY